jgi:uncharacterized protein (TIGR02145 family)
MRSSCFIPAIRMRHCNVAIAILLLLPSLSNGQYYLYKITDLRDGKLYKTVHIDDKWWMAENLNYGTRIDNILAQGNNSMPEKYCYLNNEYNCTIYGGLYQWDELMQYGNVEFNRGLCPSGWHVSSDDEWKQLEAYLGMSQTSIDAIGDRGFMEGGKLKSLTSWASPNKYASDSLGFSALAAGYRDTTSKFIWKDTATYFWNADAYNGYPWSRGLGYHYGKIYRSYSDRRFGASARCIKDSPYMFGRGSFTDPRDGKQYATVLIANHWWMAENLNAGTRINHDIEQADNNSIQKYCYNDNEAYCDTFGGLYQWDETMQFSAEDKQGVCPEGWHIPTDEDWMALEWAAGMGENDINLEGWRGYQGVFLQPEGFSGFNALLGGAVYAGKTMNDCNTFAYLWTSSEGRNYQEACMRGLEKDYYTVNRRNDFYKNNAHSVRCVRNDDEIVSLSVESEDTICAGTETTLRVRTHGGTKEKYYYWWSEPAGFSSQDSVVKVNPSVGTKYFVRVIDGYVYIRDSVKMVIRPAPDFYFTGETSVCPTDENLEYHVLPGSTYNYEWFEIDGGTIISSNQNQALVKWDTTPGDKYVGVKATDLISGCSAEKSLKVNVMLSPRPEIILKGKSLLICTNPGLAYQWYHNDEPIDDANKQFYYAKNKESGNYMVEAVLSNDCLRASLPINFHTKSTGDPGGDEYQTVYLSPNPTEENITMEMINDYTGPLEIDIISSTGQIVKQFRLNKYQAIFSTSIELSGLAENSYLMAVKYGTESEVQRITIKK